ncbi:hypothetical protein ASE12_04370 [Aeromicrobium sp. Root236]|uniref:hypothetical protein n=1 Tax=Aeromicrobium sp. Root236 TaxID=1736498 RepID=UPI00070087BF|nr:hypothetical protein [Aeromicrobium sp. Root236]KRC64062.1 hypothetical protein ASE12_04370 [Aeromicrobium sp. Root236]
MALIVCPLCVREDDVVVLRTLPDGRKEAECTDCKFTFPFGSPTPEPKPAATRKSTPRRAASTVVAPRPIAYVVPQFPKATDVDAAALERVEALKQEFLATPYEPDPLVVRHWAKFTWVFSADGLDKATIYDLKLFADDQTGASTGDPTEFDKAWVLLGELEGARRVRAVTAHLLRGPGELEDRFSNLVDQGFAYSMPGWGEALLTKTLAVADPDRFLPIVTYSDKRAIVESLYGLELADVDLTSWTIGRLGVWSNDLLVELLGDGFADLHHAAAFLRWAHHH